MNKDEARSAVMGAISMALKNPTLQQGFEIICKNLAELEKENAKLKEKLKPENCLKLLAKDGYIKFTSEQLTKAEKIIELLLSDNRIMKAQFESEEQAKIWFEHIHQAEQFLLARKGDKIK